MKKVNKGKQAALRRTHLALQCKIPPTALSGSQTKSCTPIMNSTSSLSPASRHSLRIGERFQRDRTRTEQHRQRSCPKRNIHARDRTTAQKTVLVPKQTQQPLASSAASRPRQQSRANDGARAQANDTDNKQQPFNLLTFFLSNFVAHIISVVINQFNLMSTKHYTIC